MSAPATYPGFPPTPPPPTPPTPQYPGQPSYPVAPGQLPGQYPQYPQQTAPAYPQQYPQAQGYPAPQMAPPVQPLASGTLDDFFNQPSTGGGKSLSFHGKPYGTTYVGIVTRPLGAGDVVQQTDTTQRPQFYKDGRPKFVMKVPLQMQPSPEYPDGLAQWFVKGQARDELVRAMAEAGAPAGPPEAHAIISITYTGERPSGAGMNPAKQFRVVYQRPDGSAGNATQLPAAQPGVPVSPPAPQAAPPAPAPAAQQAYAPPMDPAQAQAAANVAAQFPQATPVAPPQAPPAAPAQVDPTAGMDAAQQALLARLTGQPAG